ncbi:DUF1345 domain-containing protein [Phenylobacterium sp. LjRoot219]|uniref:DUF1345 domain-containing protein n=1 Tax=Phenylobacterium sp. LjRoot219 TaxID=3342283 RepID=UPI003ECC39E0
MAQSTLPSWFGPFAARPRLVLAIAGGVLAALGLRFVAGLQPVAATLLGWDFVCLAYAWSVLATMARSSPDGIRARAAQEDQGRVTILAVVLVAAVAAIVAIMLELSQARQSEGLARSLHVALAFLTVAASWFMVHLMFGQHYAHDYYDQRASGEGDTGGLRFPGEKEPDDWDFLYFAVIVGVAAQTADVSITSRSLRRLNTVHALFAFAFNTVIVALTINLLAGLVA